MRASQELRWKQRIRENEDRRRRYEETSKRLELEEKKKAQQALEQRRAERARMDDLMRHPSQAPAPPKKPILRKGSGAVLRPPVKAAAGSCCSPRPATVPVQGSVAPLQCTTAALGPGLPARAATAGAGSNQQSCMVDRQRREWADSLKQFIAGQREAGKPKQDTRLPADDGLSWKELKVAAEAGFEELLRTQEAAAMAAAAAGQQHTPAWRRPGMTRATGGGGSTAEQWAGAPGLEWAPLGTPSQLPYASSPSSMAPHPTGSSSSSSSSPPVSKWAARMQQARGAAEAACSSAQGPGCSNDLQSPGIDGCIAPAAPAGPTVQLKEQQPVHTACQPETQDEMQDANKLGQPAACPADQPDAQQQLLQQADLLQEAGQQDGQHIHYSQLQDTTALVQQLQPACDGHQGSDTSGAASRALSPAGHSSTACSSPGSEVAAVGALPVEYDEAQHLTAAAAEAAAALKASMDQLHRSTEQAGRSCDLAASAPGHTSPCTLSTAEASQPTAAASQHEASDSSSRGSDHEHSTCCAYDASPDAPRALCAVPAPADVPLLQPAAGGAAAASPPLCAAAADAHCLLMGETQQAAVAPPQHDQAGLQEERYGTAAIVKPVAQAAAVPNCSLAQLQLQLQRHRQEQELELEPVISEGRGGSLGQGHAIILQTDAAACSTLPVPPDELLASGLSAAGSQQGSCTEAALGCVASGAQDAVAADVRHIQDHNTCVDHQQQDIQQQALLQQQQLRGTEDHLIRPVRPEDDTNVHCSRLHALVADGSHAPDRQPAQAAPSMSEAEHAPDGSAAPASPSTTLDSLLAEAKQLAALRRAVGAEFAAMGRNRVAAVMGAVGPLTGSSGTTGHGSSCGDGSNIEMGCSARCDKPAGQWQPPDPAQEHGTQQPLVTPLQAAPGSSSAWLADSPHRAATGDGYALQDTAQHTVPPQGPWVCAVGPGQYTHTTEGPVQRQQHQQCQTHKQQQQEQPTEQQQQQQQEEVEPQHPWRHREQAMLRQQQQRQQYTPAVHTQQQAVASSRDTMPVPLTAALGVDLNRPAAQLCLTSNPLYQSSPQSPGSASCIFLPSHDQQPHLGGQGGAHTARYHQKQLQQQHEQPEQLQQQKLDEEIMLLSVESQPQLQQSHAQQVHHESHQPIPTQTATGLRLHSRPAALACPIQQQDSSHCHWQAGSSSQHDAAGVTAARQLQDPVVAGGTVQQQAPLSSGYVFDTAAASQGQLAWAGPAVSGQVAQHQWMYPGPSSSCTRMASTAAATAPRTELHALSWPHKAEAMSAGAAPWLVQLPPLCDAGPAGATCAGPVGPSTAAVAAECSRACDSSPERGSSRSSSPQSSHFLSKLASKARSAVFSAVGRFNGSMQHQHLHPTQQQLQMQMQQQQQQQQQVAAVQAQLPGATPRTCSIQTEDQGSYVAAALVAQQRAQVDAAEREHIRAAAEAAKQAAARRLAAERAEAQRRAAEQVAQHKQPPPVAIGSYARQQPPQQHAQISTQHQGQQQAQRSPEQCQPEFMTQDIDQQLDGYGQENAPAGQHALGRTAAAPPVLKKASGPCKGSHEQQQAADGQGKQPVLPRGPAPNRNSSPRRRAVRQGTTTSPAVMAAAAGPPTPTAAAVGYMGPVGVDVPAVLARAVDQYAPVSRIPAAPGSKPGTPCCSGAAGSSSPSHHGAASRGLGTGRQLQQQAAAASMGACQASRAGDSDEDDDFAFLERELQEDAMAACQPARPGVLELQQGQTGQGYWTQQQQAQQQQPQHGKVLHHHHQQQGPQQPAHDSYQQGVMSQPLELYIRADPAGAGGPYPGKGPSSMWAAVHAATGSQACAGAAAGKYSSWSGGPQHPGSHTAQQPQQLPVAAVQTSRAPAAPAAAAAARPAGPASRHGIRGTTGAAATQAASASILAAPGGHVPTGAYSAAAAAAAAPAQQQLQHKARGAFPQPKHGALSTAPQPPQAPGKPVRKLQQQQQQHQQSSRLSLEEAGLLAELQQLDQRMHQPSHLQQTDAPARSAKLPVLAVAAAAAGGGASQLRTRAATARGAAASKSPARHAPTTAPEQRAAAGCNGMKLAAVRGATGSRGSSSSSSGARSDPTAGRLSQQQSRTGKQARLVALPSTVGAGAKAGGSPSPKRPAAGAVTVATAGAAGGVAAGPAGAGGPMPSAAVLPPWVMPGMMGQGAAVPGVFPGGCGPQGYWWAPGGQCGYANPGVAWPEGPAAAGGGGGSSWPSEAAYRAPGQPSTRGEHMGVMMEPRGPAVPAWLGQQPAHGPVPWQQQVWWQGQLQPQDLSHPGHPYSQQLHAGMPYSPGAISQVHGQGGFPCPYPSARSGTPQPHSNHCNGSGQYPMQGPPLTAPSGMREVPGSPAALLPTLHYQQTAMRDRTSSRGGAESGSGGESWQVAYAGQAAQSPGTASGPGSRWGSAGSGSSNAGSARRQQDGVAAASSWGCRVAQEAADVWPARGLERSVLSGIQTKGGVGRGDGDGPGEIVVYNAHLLLS